MQLQDVTCCCRKTKAFAGCHIQLQKVTQCDFHLRTLPANVYFSVAFFFEVRLRRNQTFVKNK